MKQAIFDPYINIERIVIVGLGGNGSHVARHIGRMLFHRKQTKLSVPQLVLVDGDKVEGKNVGRQMFAPADIGHNKAEVIMRRLNASLGLNTVAYPTNVNSHHLSGAQIVIGCVDSHHGRSVIQNTLGPSYGSHLVNNAVWIDAGNHHDVGQVVLGNGKSKDVNWRKGIGENDDYITYRCLPYPGVVFPALLEKEEVTPISCAEAMALGDQHLMINDWMALVVANYVHQLLYREPITSFMTWVSVGFVRPVPISAAELRAKVPDLPVLYGEDGKPGEVLAEALDAAQKRNM